MDDVVPREKLRGGFEFTPRRVTISHVVKYFTKAIAHSCGAQREIHFVIHGDRIFNGLLGLPEPSETS